MPKTKYSLVFKPMNTRTVLNLLPKLLKSAWLLRRCPDVIAESLCSIFDCSIHKGRIFPGHWKCAKVHALFKQGEYRDLNKYRLISVIPVVAKVFERITYDQAFAFLNKYNLLLNCQSGFR